MKFEDLLFEYEQNLDHFERLKKHLNLKSDYDIGYLQGYKDRSINWFNKMKLYCEDFNPLMRKPTLEEEQKYIEGSDKDLIGIIDYRNDTIPVYNDDYGQCMYTYINGQVVSGGTYNMNVEQDFCYFYDTVKDFILPDKKE